MRLRSRFLLGLLALTPHLAGAQGAVTTRLVQGATILGVVHDSIAGTPLAGATVQLVPSGAGSSHVGSTTTDSLGRFQLDDVPDGEYTIGFLHPALDALGVDAPLRQLRVAGGRTVRADLAIPSPARLRAAICGPRAAPDSVAVVVGIVRNASDHSPAAGVSVAGEWLELTFQSGGVRQRVARLVATTGDNGWFAICNVPRGGTMTLRAMSGADSTGSVEVQVPAGGFAQRALYLGRSADGASARLSGTVVTVEGSRPVPGAIVALAGGSQVRANERGEWSIAGAPGTHMLEVRAVGYYPDRRAVHLLPRGEPLRVALFTFEAMLDTVRVSASRLLDRHRGGFEERRRTGIGRYLGVEEIARNPVIVTSDLFRRMPGVRVEIVQAADTISPFSTRNEPGTEPPDMEPRVVMRGSFTPVCLPAIYVDGLYMDRATAADIDSRVRPADIVGIEVYASSSAPVQFQRGMSGCGSILIWTR